MDLLRSTLLSVCFLLACTIPAFAAAAGATHVAPPATFEGEIPCADCTGIKVALTLYADGAYFLRRTYVGKGPNSYVERGKWQYDADGRLVLRSGPETPSYYRVGNGSIVMLDVHGDPIDSKLNFTLIATKEVDRFHDLTHWRGTYTYIADSARFKDCLTGRTYPVAPLHEAASLERAYAAARKEPGAPVLVTFEGHVADVPRVEGAGTMETIVVDKMDKAWAAASCESAPPSAPASLEGRGWILTELDGKAVATPSERERPSLEFDAVSKRVSGSTGCNRLTGSYTVDGDNLRFSPLATTRRACLNGEDLEQPFLAALGRVTAFKIDAGTLELSAGGASLARFAAVPLPPAGK